MTILIQSTLAVGALVLLALVVIDALWSASRALDAAIDSCCETPRDGAL